MGKLQVASIPVNIASESMAQCMERNPQPPIIDAFIKKPVSFPMKGFAHGLLTLAFVVACLNGKEEATLLFTLLRFQSFFYSEIANSFIAQY